MKYKIGTCIKELCPDGFFCVWKIVNIHGSGTRLTMEPISVPELEDLPPLTWNCEIQEMDYLLEFGSGTTKNKFFIVTPNFLPDEVFTL